MTYFDPSPHLRHRTRCCSPACAGLLRLGRCRRQGGLVHRSRRLGPADPRLRFPRRRVPSASGAGSRTGRISEFQCRYHDIVPDRRIAYTYDMYVDDKRISVSLATVEFTAKGAGTHLKLTEQIVHLDGYPTPEDREAGTAYLVGKAAAWIESQSIKCLIFRQGAPPCNRHRSIRTSASTATAPKPSPSTPACSAARSPS
ncbi:MAG: SRPBCC domain-containing protein [Asticcacaulis sp.]